MKVPPASPVTGLALALLGVGVAGYLTVVDSTGGSPICGFGQGCEVVAQSAYARVGDIPIAAFGLLMYLVLAVLYGMRLLGPPDAVHRLFRLTTAAIALAGTVLSAWLTYLELFVLHAICLWCVASATVITLLLALSLAEAVGQQRRS